MPHVVLKRPFLYRSVYYGALAAAISACTAAAVPEIYHGRVGKRVLAVPSRIAGSVLYDGESDWTPPLKPKKDRTDRDPIRSIEFFVDLDNPNSIITEQAAREQLAQSSGALHLPTLYGHVLGLTATFQPENPPDALTLRSRFSGKDLDEPAFQALSPSPPEFGLETRRADWSRPVKGRTLHGTMIFDVDVDYLSTAENTYLFCNDGRQSVAPFLPMPTCQFMIVEPALKALISGSIDRADVPRWRELRSAALATIHSFHVEPHDAPLLQRPL